MVSHNAVAGRGGQGICLANTLAGFDASFSVRLFDAAAVPASRTATLLGRIPLVRRRRDWHVELTERAFDRHVAAALAPLRAALFHGATGQCLATQRAARRAGMPVVLDVVTMHVQQFADAARTSCAEFGARAPFHPAYVRRCVAEYHEADLIRTMSEPARASLIARGVPAEKIVAALPPIDVGRFPEARFAHDRFRVAYVGALEPWKGFRYLVEAFDALPVKDAELMLWGGSGARGVSSWLGERLARNPRITARPVDVAGYGYDNVYGAASVLVHPSLTDGFALVVAEAMACGIPVIVTDQTGAAELVEEGVSGYVVPARDSGAITERLAHLAAHPALVRDMGAAARRTVAGLTLERFRAAWIPRVRSLL